MDAVSANINVEDLLLDDYKTLRFYYCEVRFYYLRTANAELPYYIANIEVPLPEN